MTRLATLSCLLVSALDMLQLFVRPWETARLGAVGGALLYAFAAVFIATERTTGLWIARLVPVIPTAIILANAAAGTQPDPWLVCVYAVQLVAAYDAWAPTPAHPQA